jgi:hypothetical protein
MICSLFPELKENIFMSLSCKYIISLSLCCSNLNKFIKDNDIINKRKYQGFPRLENHCKSHDISNLDISSLTDFSWNNLYEISYPDILNNILDLLLKLNIDLVRGDLIYYDRNKFIHDDICIFDGIKIISLYNEVDDQGLPPEFTVLNNNINLYYWESKYDKNSGRFEGRISYDSLVWLDITEDIRTQLINNINYDGKSYFSEYEPSNSNEIFYTKFCINNKHYYIISPVHRNTYNVYGEHFQKKYSDIFFEIFTLKSKIALRYNDTNEIFENRIGNALFLDIDFNFKTKF